MIWVLLLVGLGLILRPHLVVTYRWWYLRKNPPLPPAPPTETPAERGAVQLSGMLHIREFVKSSEKKHVEVPFPPPTSAKDFERRLLKGLGR